MEPKDLKEIEEIFKRHIGILVEDYQHKLDIVVEGHQMLSDKIDRVEAGVEERLIRVETKIDSVAIDLAAHRADTEGHKVSSRGEGEKVRRKE